MKKRWRDQWALVGIFVAVLLLFGGFNPRFLSANTFGSLVNRIPTLTLAVTGMTLVLVVGGIDLSMGSVLALSGAVFGILVSDWHWSVLGSALVSIGVGSLMGLFNGCLIEGLRVPAFIVTLGTLEGARGVAYLVTGSQTKYLGGHLEWLIEPLIGLPLSGALLMAVLAMALGEVLLSRTVPGRRMIAVGTNETAASLAGIRPRPLKIAVFTASGALAGVASICQMARLGASDPNAGAGLELAAIAAAVIGGTSLSGGRGSVFSSFVGVLIIATVETGLAQIGASEPVKRVVTGGVIVAAVLADTWRKRAR